LRQALAVLRTEAGLEEGVPALVRASRRGQDHVARTVKRCFGVTPSLLVRKARLDAAAVRLRTGSEHILTIALACGFDNASYFTRAFRDRFGCTPRAYRNGTAAIGSEIAS
jgi:AraC family cel operon transcriptional repressor